jgi:L-lactate dehydrogenase complex protein LldE
MDPSHPSTDRPRVALLATCLVDLYRPSVGFASAELLHDAGCEVVVPEQTCCGQPAYNSGDRRSARVIAEQLIENFEGFDFVVAPSGSCIGMVTEHVPELFETDSQWRARAQALAEKSYELTDFLVNIRHYRPAGVSLQAVATYHDSCSGLRELGVKTQPRELLQAVDGMEIDEMTETEVCCGFGGTFCVKYPEISERMVTNKIENIRATTAGMLLGGDLGCLLNIAGRATRTPGRALRVMHVAEVLTGRGHEPGIGEGNDGRGS